MSKIQQLLTAPYVSTVLYVGVMAAFVCGVYYVATFLNAKKPITSTTVELRSAAPQMSFATMRRSGGHSIAFPGVASRGAAAGTVAPTIAMGSTSAHIHQTSSASVHSIGGGSMQGSGALATVSGSRNSGRGIHATSSAYTGSIYIPIQNHSVTAVGASNADQVVQQKMGITPRRSTTDGELPGYNEDPEPDEVVTPVGDVAWILMFLLAAGYCYHIFLRKRPQSKEISK